MAAAPVNVSKRALRQFLQAVLVTDSDLEAFCLDYFPAIKRRFSSGMDRDAKLSLLIESEPPEVILQFAREAEPKRSNRFLHLMEGNVSDPADDSSYRSPSIPSNSLVERTDRNSLLDALLTLSQAKFEEVIFRLGLPRATLLPSGSSSQMERAIQLIEQLESEQGEAGLKRLAETVRRALSR